LFIMAEQLRPERDRIEELLAGIPVVDARGLRKVYDTGSGRVEALRGVDLIVARGEIVSIAGPSGSGKSTLLNCLSGLDDVDAGEIRIDGLDLRRMSDNERTDLRARRIGFVFQSFNLLPMLSAEENVELPLLIAGQSGRKARRRAGEALARVGLDGVGSRPPDELSGGEQQRVAIARAIVHDPALLFADEPTGSLDSETARQIVDLLVALNADGQTIVVVTHNPDVARRTGRVLRMSDGTLS
jgi:putative ABC transport system ATP-binding protein